jgi:hypothetical protein
MLKNKENSARTHQNGNHHNRYQTDHQIEHRALKAYSEFSSINNAASNPNPRYMDKTPKSANLYSGASNEYIKRDK